MGVKRHCEELERQGYVDTWRRPKPIGRPEKVHRLTLKALTFFPAASNTATIALLNAANRLYGHAAAEKLLYSVFSAKTDEYLNQLQGQTVIDLARALRKIRDEEGYLCELTCEDPLLLTEYHSPIYDLLSAFPLVRRLEREMMERVLGVRLERHEEMVSGLYRCQFKMLA